jgi:phosphoribosylaminoimidazolecarboxamide formyltransferase / IMP cyclohydrolase
VSDIKIRRALISAFEKAGIVELGRVLAGFGVELVSTGGTAKLLRDAGLAVVDVSAVTGFPEILDGRVKTLHPAIHGGLLFRRADPEHVATALKHDIKPIDLVVVSLYPFERVVRDAGAGEADKIEMIDVGGPAMIRAASKNFESVTVVAEACDVSRLVEELEARRGATSLEFRKAMAARAFARTASYDAAIARALSSELLPPRLVVAGTLAQELRYGENPHQRGALYRTEDPGEATVAHARQRSGKDLSYNNILDAAAALEIARFLMYPCAVVIKHKNPCGAAMHPTDLVEAFRRAHAGDPVSAFGGILAFNRPVDSALAREIATKDKFFEVIVAPAYVEDALPILTESTKWGKNVRLLETHVPLSERHPEAGVLEIRTVSGGFLVQDRDVSIETSFDVTSRRAPSREEVRDLQFAWEIARHVTSNAIVFAKDATVVGVGAGQMSRVDSVHLAARKSGERARGAVMASDAFFPFSDAVLAAADAGIVAVVHPGGSIRDAEVIKAADERGLALVRTGKRHFRH